MTETPDVLEAAKPWMQQCGPHDVGLDSVGCACPPDEDPRPIVSRLAAEIESLRTKLTRLERRLEVYRYGDVKPVPMSRVDVADALAKAAARVRSGELAEGSVVWQEPFPDQIASGDSPAGTYAMVEGVLVIADDLPRDFIGRTSGEGAGDPQ